jgi:hypothetical protein
VSSRDRTAAPVDASTFLLPGAAGRALTAGSFAGAIVVLALVAT